MNSNIPQFLVLDGWKYLISKENPSTVSIWHHVTPDDGGYGTEVKVYVDDHYFENNTVQDLYKRVCSHQYYSSEDLDGCYELIKLKNCLESFGLHPTMPPELTHEEQSKDSATAITMMPNKDISVKAKQDWDVTLFICSKCGTPQEPAVFCKVCGAKLRDKSYKTKDSVSSTLIDCHKDDSANTNTEKCKLCGTDLQTDSYGFCTRCGANNHDVKLMSKENSKASNCDSFQANKSSQKTLSQNDINKLLNCNILLEETSMHSPNGHGSITSIFKYSTYTIESETFFSDGKNSNCVVNKIEVPKNIRTLGELREFWKGQPSNKLQNSDHKQRLSVQENDLSKPRKKSWITRLFGSKS